jgi:hypothetical protein
MDIIFSNINWLAIVLAWFLAFMLGSLWYSERLFLTKWKEGLGTQSVPGRPLSKLLLVQAISTFLFTLALRASLGVSLAFTIFVAITSAVMTYANGLYSGKSLYTIFTETFYILAQSALILIVLALIR